MDILFAFIGAIIGGIITVQYMYAADRRKIRAEVMLEVVAYCDNIYHLVQTAHVHKDAVFTRNFNEIPNAAVDYDNASQQLTALLKTSVPHAKLAIAFGEAEALGDFNTLTEQFREVTSILRHAT